MVTYESKKMVVVHIITWVLVALLIYLSAFSSFATGEYQSWANYPDSPLPTSQNMYQCIWDAGTPTLLMSSAPIYNAYTSSTFRLKSTALTYRYDLISGVWTNMGSYSAGTQMTNGPIGYMKEANHNIYYLDGTTLHFAKTIDIYVPPIIPTMIVTPAWNGEYYDISFINTDDVYAAKITANYNGNPVITFGDVVLDVQKTTRITTGHPLWRGKGYYYFTADFRQFIDEDFNQHPEMTQSSNELGALQDSRITETGQFELVMGYISPTTLIKPKYNIILNKGDIRLLTDYSREYYIKLIKSAIPTDEVYNYTNVVSAALYDGVLNMTSYQEYVLSNQEIVAGAMYEIIIMDTDKTTLYGRYNWDGWTNRNDSILGFTIDTPFTQINDLINANNANGYINQVPEGVDAGVDQATNMGDLSLSELTVKLQDASESLTGGLKGMSFLVTEVSQAFSGVYIFQIFTSCIIITLIVTAIVVAMKLWRG